MTQTTEKIVYQAILTSAVKRRLVWLCVSLLGLQAFCAHALTQQQVTSSLLYNFAKNVKWPNEADTVDEFQIGLWGIEDALLINELAKMEQTRKIKGRSIKIKKLDSLADTEKLSMLYAPGLHELELTALLARLTNQSLLIITRNQANPNLVMINIVDTNDASLSFEVNKANMIMHGLSALPELILTGGSEIDVAELYRQGQTSLLSLQAALSQKESKLNSLEIAINQQMLENNNLAIHLDTIREAIRVREEDNKKLKSEAEQRAAILKNQQEVIDFKQAEFNSLVDEIQDSRTQLQTLSQHIAEQKREIGAKNNAINQLDTLVETQRVSLTNLWLATILGVLLLVSVFGAYLIKRRDNRKLKLRTQELKMAHDNLKIAKARADDANRAKSEFLSLMSHEFRTPLQAIIGYTEIVKEDLDIESKAHYSKDLNRVIENSDRLLRLINGLLDLAKIESGRIDLEVTPVSLPKLMNEVLMATQVSIDKNHNQFILNLENIDTPIEIDREKLLHIMINLVSNAAKFTLKGTITVDIQCATNHLDISVSDTGIGMTEAQQKVIFERFQQADSSITRKFQGTGLGLSITKRFCECMGGEISVTSKLDLGSQFKLHFDLPIISSKTDEHDKVAALTEKKPSLQEFDAQEQYLAS